MNAKDELEIAKICNRVMVACEAFRAKSFSHKQWRESLEFAIQESNRILFPQGVSPQLASNHSDVVKVGKAWDRDTRMVDWSVEHHVILHGKLPWRWIDSDEVPGMVHGFPQCRGIPRVTNGVLVYIEKPNGQVFQGHMDWFMPDSMLAKESKQTKTKQKTKVKDLFDKLVLD